MVTWLKRVIVSVWVKRLTTGHGLRWSDYVCCKFYIILLCVLCRIVSANAIR